MRMSAYAEVHRSRERPITSAQQYRDISRMFICHSQVIDPIPIEIPATY